MLQIEAQGPYRKQVNPHKAAYDREERVRRMHENVKKKFLDLRAQIEFYRSLAEYFQGQAWHAGQALTCQSDMLRTMKEEFAPLASDYVASKAELKSVRADRKWLFGLLAAALIAVGGLWFYNRLLAAENDRLVSELAQSRAETEFAIDRIGFMNAEYDRCEAEGAELRSGHRDLMDAAEGHIRREHPELLMVMPEWPVTCPIGDSMLDRTACPTDWVEETEGECRLRADGSVPRECEIY